LLDKDPASVKAKARATSSAASLTIGARATQTSAAVCTSTPQPLVPNSSRTIVQHDLNQEISATPSFNPSLKSLPGPTPVSKSAKHALPFMDSDDYQLTGLPTPAKPLLKPSALEENCFILPGNNVFIDKVLPSIIVPLTQRMDFPVEYFVALHKLVSTPTTTYPAYTPNHRGARIPLQHTRLNIPRWRHHLTGYEDAEIIQFLEFGFPIGLSDDPPAALVSSLRNHGSSYQYYTYLDEFLSSGLERCELAGPCRVPPFTEVHVSPLMTAVKKPSGRRAVFDASFGDMSLNNCTPQDTYLSQPFTYDFPKIEDFKRFVIKCGKGSYCWKRDLSRYYLQIPVDPIEYPLLCFVWRTMMFFFCALMFGLRHAGLQGQKVTTAVTWIHRRLGLETDTQQMFNSLNYSDDIGGCETSLDRATESFNALGSLFKDLGLDESTSKAHPPSTSMPYLGIQFDTVTMRMSIPPDKIAEVREEVSIWMKRTSASKKSLQQLLGRLFWVSRCIRFSRGFMGRLITQLQQMHAMPDQKKLILSQGCKEDIAWWNRYLRRFNGIEMLYPTDPLGLSLDQLLDTSALVNCGDAQPNGGGAYFGAEYWSRTFPIWLQDLPIHIKELWVVVVSAWLWADQWKGNMVYVFSDNVAVVEVLDKERPKDPKMLELLQEFLYIVCTRGFTPIFRWVGTEENKVADFISRNHDPATIASYLKSNDLPMRKCIKAPDNLFTLRSNW
jgi:hypothetical protein